ncbi:30379_t:CDS:2, partial [Gigaspora margarita]
NFEEEWEDQKELPEDPKEAKKEPEDNDSNNVKKLYKRPKVDKKKRFIKRSGNIVRRFENEPEDNDSTSLIAFYSSFLYDNDDSKKRTGENN